MNIYSFRYIILEACCIEELEDKMNELVESEFQDGFDVVASWWPVSSVSIDKDNNYQILQLVMQRRP